VDADAGDNKRKMVAFVGGLDICMGRYDTQKHSLFRTLQTVHKDDYYNPTFTVNHSINLLNCPYLCVARESLQDSMISFSHFTSQMGSILKHNDEHQVKWVFSSTLTYLSCNLNRSLLLVVQDNHGMICILVLMVQLHMTSSPTLRSAG
jgi:hypothetical protein